MTGKRERARRETRRRFEQWARNPECHSNVMSAVHNVKMGAAARRENPNAPRDGQSVFALSRGLNFEASLVDNDGEILLGALIRSGVLASASSGLLDHRIAANGGPLADLDGAIAAGHEFLNTLAREQSFSGAISSFTVRIPRGVMLPEAILIIDLLAVDCSGETPTISVGEIKTYADRGGHTSKSDLATARAQMGLYVHALETTIDGLGLSDAIHVSSAGFLVLTYPGSNRPSIRSGEDLRFQRERARRGFDIMESAAQLMNGEYGAGDEDDPEDLLDLVLHADTHFQDSCISFCERANACFERALESGRGVVLGDETERFLNGISLHRADELMSGDKPRTLAESDFLNRMTIPLPELP